MEKNICFLFGAGAEGKNNYNIVCGYQYFKSTLFLNSMDDVYPKLFEAIKKNRYFKICDKSYTYTNKVYSITITIFKKFFNEYINEKEKNNERLSPEEKQEIISLFDKKFIEKLNKKPCFSETNIENKNPTINSNEIIAELGKILISSNGIKYDEINSKLLKKMFFENKELRENFNINVANILDSYFCTIIDPQKYGKYNFTKIFNYYWTCYFVIVKSIIENTTEDNKNKIEEYFDNDGFNCKKVILNINDFTEKLYSFIYDSTNKTYYDLIFERIQNDNNIKVNVLTTNYYKFVEKLDSDPAYLNGCLKKFELPEILEVVDWNSEKLDWNKYLFFPFIFGQSLVKPIVNSYQIEQFKKALDKLNESDYLVIIGYRINDDDNHVNSLIHNSIVDNKFKKIIIVGEDEIKIVKKNLRIDNNDYDNKFYLINFNGKNNEEIINMIFKMILCD